MALCENSYMQGSAMAWRHMLKECCRQLGYDDPEAQKSSWISEREEAISALRNICSDYGDNDWENNSNLSDVIEKHLHRNLVRK